MKPIIIGSDQLQVFEQDNVIRERIDLYESQCAELQRIYSLSGEPAEIDAGRTYVYYPWNQTLLICIDEAHLFELRTNRNKNLITQEEQNKLAAATVGIAGMSVGAGIAIGVTYAGISDRIKIADNDVLDTSNLNRLRESLLSVGKPKTELAARHIYEINPYAQVEQFNEGVTAQNIGKFFDDLSVVVDEIDDFKMKVQLRLQARQAGVPLIMFTSLGDNILIDIERYDLDNDLPIFHGLLTGVSDEILASDTMRVEDIRRYSVQLVGQEYIPTRALQSVAEMGRTLVGRPQLYSTIAVDGGLATFVIRKILLENEPASGRYFVKFNDLIGLGSPDLAETDERKATLERLFSRG